MKKIYKQLNNFIRGREGKQMFFIAMAVMLFALLVWFVILNFIFLVSNLNIAFSTNFKPGEPEITFDKKGFENLNLVDIR